MPFPGSFSGTAALEEDAQILKVIEAYCTSAKTRQTLNSSKKKQTLTHADIQTKEERFILDLALFVAAASVFCTQCLSLTLFCTDPSNNISSSSCFSSIPLLLALFSLSLSFPHVLFDAFL